MKRIRLKLETFQKINKEPEPWEQSVWDDEDERPPERLSDYTPLTVEGGINALAIDSYMAVRDDRVAVVMESGRVHSVVSSLAEFEQKLTEVGL